MEKIVFTMIGITIIVIFSMLIFIIIQQRHNNKKSRLETEIQKHNKKITTKKNNLVEKLIPPLSTIFVWLILFIIHDKDTEYRTIRFLLIFVTSIMVVLAYHINKISIILRIGIIISIMIVMHTIALFHMYYDGDMYNVYMYCIIYLCFIIIATNITKLSLLIKNKIV